MAIYLFIQHDVKELSESVSRVHHLKTSPNDVERLLTQDGENNDSFVVSNNDDAYPSKAAKQDKVGVKGRKRPIVQTNENVQLKRRRIVKTGKPGKPSKSKLTMSKTTKKSKHVSI